MPFPDQNHLNIHKSSQRHISKATGVARVSKAKNQRKTARDAANLANKKFHCAICDSSLPEKSSLNRHYRTKKHIGYVGVELLARLNPTTLLSGILDLLDFSFLSCTFTTFTNNLYNQ
jgi:hypothetical protein